MNLKDFSRIPYCVPPQLHASHAAVTRIPQGSEHGLSATALFPRWGLVGYILQEGLTPVDTEATFEDMIRSCYPEETTVGLMKFDTCDLMKSQDPISWNIARDEYIDELASDEQIISFDKGSTYYWMNSLQELLIE